MGGFWDHVQRFYHFNTIFGSLGFNIVCCTCNVIELLALVILIGVYHSSISAEYIWYPIIEIVRIFILTIARFDVMLKGVDDFQRNRAGFRNTRYVITITNLVGAISIILLAPLYFALLPTALTNRTNVMRLVFITLLAVFILLRIVLSLPMITTLVTGQNLFFMAVNEGYQRINEELARDPERDPERDSNRSEQSDATGPHGEMNADELLRLRHQMLVFQQRQMELAIEESRRQSFRCERRLQDQEYQRAVDEFRRSSGDLQRAELIDMPQEPEQEQEEEQEEDEELLEETVKVKVKVKNPVLEPLPDEVQESPDTVSVRIRLPNGVRCVRVFLKSATIAEVNHWVKHECVKSSLLSLVNNFQLISTMPRTEYSQQAMTMEELGFWRPNSGRKLVTPVLYVEETDSDFEA